MYNSVTIKHGHASCQNEGCSQTFEPIFIHCGIDWSLCIYYAYFCHSFILYYYFQEFHVAYVYLKMANSPRPGVWALERSTDLGKTWKAWQYFADTPSDCYNFFGMEAASRITADDTVVCTTEYSKVVPLEGGEVSSIICLQGSAIKKNRKDIFIL